MGGDRFGFASFGEQKHLGKDCHGFEKDGKCPEVLIKFESIGEHLEGYLTKEPNHVGVFRRILKEKSQYQARQNQQFNPHSVQFYIISGLETKPRIIQHSQLRGDKQKFHEKVVGMEQVKAGYIE
jgi:hypothetical protein